MYNYKMVPVPKNIIIDRKQVTPAQYLEDLCNRMSAEGWEFYRIDPFYHEIQAGCLNLFGKNEEKMENIVTFRRKGYAEPNI